MMGPTGREGEEEGGNVTGYARHIPQAAPVEARGRLWELVEGYGSLWKVMEDSCGKAPEGSICHQATYINTSSVD
jgi:hypothetical protein